MQGTGTSSLTDALSVPVESSHGKVSAAWCLITARWTMSNLNSDNLGRQRISLLGKSAKWWMHLGWSCSVQSVSWDPSLYGRSSKTAHTPAIHSQEVVSYVLSALLNEQDQHSFGRFVPSGCLQKRTHPINLSPALCIYCIGVLPTWGSQHGGFTNLPLKVSKGIICSSVSPSKVFSWPLKCFPSNRAAMQANIEKQRKRQHYSRNDSSSALFIGGSSSQIESIVPVATFRSPGQVTRPR